MNRIRVPVPSHRLLTIGAWVAGIAVLALIGYLLTTVVQLSGRSEVSLADRADIRAEVAVLEDDLAAQESASSILADQLRSLGQEPAIEPETATTRVITDAPPLDLIRTLIDIGLTAKCGGPSCKGDPGQPAAPAKDGATGAQGPPGVEGQQGPPGANGVDGAPGAPGRGIASLTCASLVTFEYVVTYTDGTTQTVTCGPATEPPAPETPEVTP